MHMLLRLVDSFFLSYLFFLFFLGGGGVVNQYSIGGFSPFDHFFFVDLELFFFF